MSVCSALEAGFVQLEASKSPRSPREAAESEANAPAAQILISVGGGYCVDVKQMVQITDQQAADSGGTTGKGEPVMREASNFLTPRVELLVVRSAASTIIDCVVECAIRGTAVLTHCSG
jgi:hypothetical protein